MSDKCKSQQLIIKIERSSLYYPAWVGTSHQEQQIYPVCSEADVDDDHEEDEAGDNGADSNLLRWSVTSK